MPIFDYSFEVQAPLEAVAQFHSDSRALKKLTPPPLFMQLHHVDPLGEGSVAEFTLWFGPIPIRWTAVHSQVSQHGFTDTQQAGPAKSWRHTHTFTAVSTTHTRIDEHIEYEHDTGFNGVLTRLLFAKPGLYLLFTYRRLMTRWHLRHQQ